MKLLKIGDKYFNTGAIERVEIVKENYARIYFSGKESSITVSRETFEEILKFSKAEELEIEITKIPQRIASF